MRQINCFPVNHLLTFSLIFTLVDHVSQASQIGFGVAVVDSVAHMMKLMGFTFQASGIVFIVVCFFYI